MKTFPEMIEELDRRQHIVLLDSDSIAPLWLRITIRPNAEDWDVRSIERYHTRDAALAGGHDRFDSESDFDGFPEAVKLAVWGRLNQWQHERKQASLAMAMSVFA